MEYRILILLMFVVFTGKSIQQNTGTNSTGDTDGCWDNPCLRGTCESRANGNFYCNCPLNYNGSRCENDLSSLGCHVDLCLNNGTCIPQNVQGVTYRCLCVQGYTGINCETEIDECRLKPCEHGSCVDLVNDYRCNCTGSGYEGPRCSSDVDECDASKFPNPCGAGTCYNNPGSFSCQCPDGFEGVGCVQDIDECESFPCKHGGNCTSGVNTYHCDCPPAYTGQDCSVDVDDCVNVTCVGDNTRCVDQVDGYTCVCKDGYAGKAPICRDIDECALNPCMADATCENLENSFNCICPKGYNGTRCDNNINECHPNPCRNNGTCNDGIASYTCDCIPGFWGDNCTEEINECIEHNINCENGATCDDLVNGYRCNCTPGWTGDLCDTNIQECDPNPCMNGGHCIDGINSYNCSCATGFTGVNCTSNINDCVDDPCQNGGQCYDGINSYTCNCSQNWMGDNCQQQYDVCIDLTPCQNGGTCQSEPPSHVYNCTCLTGFQGLNCENNIDDCPQHTCPPHEQCFDGINNYTCACPIGKKGINCSEDIDECDSEPCRNGATCQNGDGDYTCDCGQEFFNLTKYTPGHQTEFWSGWTGKNCDEDINECNLTVTACLHGAECENSAGSYSCLCRRLDDEYPVGNNCEQISTYCSLEVGKLGRPPCQNGGTCHNTKQTFRCECVPGYTGTYCEIDINECQDTPCQYNGSCTDAVNSYNCSCIPGVTGINCETNINDCWPFNPCLNYGVCNDKINSYECDCTNTGFTGQNCSENIDDCRNVVCLHGAECVDGVKEYGCACYNGYTGVLCETDIDECAAVPCQYNGTCIERSKRLDTFSYATAAGYICQCIPGITGSDCEINIDECETEPCKNGASCLDRINAFKCECAPGYNGTLCDTEINECEYRACENGATCTDLVADYFCDCADFQKGRTTYGGKNCTVVLTGCTGNVLCENGATCIPFLQNEERNEHNYTCECPPGFTGRFCGVSTTVSFSRGDKIVKTVVSDIDLKMRFRTTLKSALLFYYKPSSSSMFTSVELYQERLYAVYGTESAVLLKETVPTRNSVNDAEMHEVAIAITNDTMTVKLESSLCNSREDCTVSLRFPQLVGGDPKNLYIGNVSQSFQTYSQSTFVGCMEDILYQGEYLIPSRQESASFDGVMLGCNRSEQCDPYTCNRHGDCIDLWDEYYCDCHRPYLGRKCETEFVAATFSMDSVQSWATFTLPPQYQSKLSNEIDISLFMRTRQMDGVIMYFGNTDVTRRTFISLEMKNGTLTTRFMFCSERKTLQSPTTYNDGEAHFIRLKIMRQNLSVSVDEQLLNSYTYNASGCQFDSSIAYFGGKVPEIPSNVRRRRRQADQTVAVDDFSESSYFEGIIQDIEVNGIKLQFFPVSHTVGDSINMTDSTNLTEGSVSTQRACDEVPCERNGTCTNEFFNDFSCECPYGYRGKNCSELDFCRNATCPAGSRCNSFHNGYECISTATFDGRDSLVTYQADLNSNDIVDTISLSLRTGAEYGAILYVESGQYFVKLRLVDGHIQLNYKLNSDMSNTMIINHHSSNKINDGDLYQVKVTLGSSEFRIQIIQNETIVDEDKHTVENSVTTFSQIVHNSSKIYIGGMGTPPPGLSKEQSFQGCLEEVRIGGLLLPFFRDYLFQNNNLRTEKFIATDVRQLRQDCHRSTPSIDIRSLGHNGGVCEIGWNGKPFCTCAAGYTGTWCETNINDCSPGACSNGGVCIDRLHGYECRCPKGFNGNRCQNDVTFCNSTVCGNNGVCAEETTGFVCNCTEDYTGITCDTQLNQSCSPDLCKNGGTCEDINRTVSTVVISSFNCTCAEGFEGPLCEREIDYCMGIPCGPNGNCTSSRTLFSYSCECDSGFTGNNCETNIDDCPVGTSCLNGGACRDLVNDYVCDCNGWTGKRCEIDINECDTYPCQHGTCDNLNGSYRCNCDGTGFDGDNCAGQVNECDLETPPCKNGATCTDTEGSYNCSCTLGYEGKNCDIPNCDDGQCLNGGTCSHDNVKWSCGCVQYYEGEQCEIEGPCLNQTCDVSNTAECVQNVTHNNYTCVCNQGWEGENCSDNIDECLRETHQCRNGSTCVDTPGSYNCTCVIGYMDRFCETNIDDCEMADCNSGKCQDLVNNYTCDCSGTGYQGPSCSEDIDECETVAPCDNTTQVCDNIPGSYQCRCRDGYKPDGDKCDKDPCLDTICENEGVCNSSLTPGGIWEPLCHCAEGFEGSRCEKQGPTNADTNIWVIVGPVIAVVLMLIIIGVVVFVMMARTKRATRGTYSPSRQETSGARVELGNVLKKPPEERLI